MRIEGVYADYGNESGTILVQRETLEGWFGDRTLSNLAIYLSPGQDPGRVLESIRSAFPSLVVRTNGGSARNRSASFTRPSPSPTPSRPSPSSSPWAASVSPSPDCSSSGRTNSPSSLPRRDPSRHRPRRDVGGRRIALAGLAGGLAVSFFLGGSSSAVINPQTFGWTLRYDVPWGTFLLLSGLTLGAAAAVSRIVGFRNANLSSDREE